MMNKQKLRGNIRRTEGILTRRVNISKGLSTRAHSDNFANVKNLDERAPCINIQNYISSIL